MKRCLLILAATGESESWAEARAASGSGTQTACPRLCALRSFAAAVGNEKVEANAPTHLRRIEIEDANGLSKDMCLAQLRCDRGIGKLGGSARRIGVRDANGHIVNVLLAQLFRDGGNREAGQKHARRDVRTRVRARPCPRTAFLMKRAAKLR